LIVLYLFVPVLCPVVYSVVVKVEAILPTHNSTHRSPPINQSTNHPIIQSFSNN